MAAVTVKKWIFGGLVTKVFLDECLLINSSSGHDDNVWITIKHTIQMKVRFENGETLCITGNRFLRSDGPSISEQILTEAI